VFLILRHSREGALGRFINLWFLLIIFSAHARAQGLEDVAAVFQSTKGEASDHWLYDTDFDRQDGQIRFRSPGTFSIELGNYTSIGPIRTERFAYVKDKQKCEVAYREQVDKDSRAIQFSREAFESHKRLRKDIVDAAVADLPKMADAFDEITYYLNSVIPTEITGSNSIVRGQISNDFTLRGETSVVCRRKQIYEMIGGPPTKQVVREECSKELVLSVTEVNLARFKQVLLKTYTTLCTGAKRTPGRF
jgi:hypothetical protein